MYLGEIFSDNKLVMLNLVFKVINIVVIEKVFSIYF